MTGALPEIGVRAWGSVLPEANARLPEDLEPISNPLLGRRFRKIGRFIKLALCGAATAVNSSGLKLPPDRTAVVFGTGIGNSIDMAGFCEATLGGPTDAFPSPIQFANAIGNSGAFYVAEAFQLTGPVIALSQEDVSFECALMTARDLLWAGDADFVLAGGADVFFGDDAAQRERMKLPESVRTAFSEGSGWLLLEKHGPDSKARLDHVFVGDGAPLEALRRAGAAGPSVVSVGARLEPQAADLIHALPQAVRWPSRGAWPTEQAGQLCDFLDRKDGPAVFQSVSVTRDGFIGVTRLTREVPS
ncbi:MAG: beta-ketoacyl synthase N-terminal-like domain-containing protein [Myxococcales bacterium]